MAKNKKIVFVGMSGGVDSSVSAALLQRQGFEVVGVFIKTWHPDFLVCNEEEERRDAMRVATHLGIPFLTFDLEDVYKKEVADYMISEYRLGRTPNPDVMCNKEVKFGVFFKKALSMGADYVATGHYARTRRASKKFIKYKVIKKEKKINRLDELYEHYELLTGCDSTKDQSYFLWTLKQAQLSKTIFPVGHLNKTEVRKLALQFKLPVAEKKDSQGICFLGQVDLKDFLKHYIKEKKGKVFNERGEEIGFHNGVVFHTLGERHGFTILKKKPNDKPYYVVGKNIEKNILYVSQEKNLKQMLSRFSHSNLDAVNQCNLAHVAENIVSNFSLDLENINWISEIPKVNKIYTAQIRYHGEFLKCKIKILNKNKAKIFFKKQILVASGQSVVLYDKDICLGGGVVI